MKHVFVPDVLMLKPMSAAAQYGGSDSYDLFLIGTGYSLPGAVVSRWDDPVQGGVHFTVTTPERAR